MTWDGFFQDYADGQAAHHEGQPHLVEVHPVKVAQRRWRRFSTVAYEIRCSCGWMTKATYSSEAYRLADEHAAANDGEVLQTKRGNG